MTSLRRRLRVCVVVWLVCQTASLAALAPRDCCAAHRDASHRCDEVAPADQCRMRGDDGQPCPMHRSAGTANNAMRSAVGPGSATGHHAHDAHIHNVADATADNSADPAVAGAHAGHVTPDGWAPDRHAPSSNDCRLVAACDGPMAALLSLLANHGILPSTTLVAPESDSGRVSSAVPVDVHGRFQPPDPPPPRS